MLRNKEGFVIEERSLRHLQMISWPDDLAPTQNLNQLETFEYLLQEQKGARLQFPDSPVLVHCSAGIGRTGTFIATALIIEAAE